MTGMMATLSSCAAPARKPRLQLLERILGQIEGLGRFLFFTPFSKIFEIRNDPV